MGHPAGGPPRRSARRSHRRSDRCGRGNPTRHRLRIDRRTAAPRRSLPRRSGCHRGIAVGIIPLSRHRPCQCLVVVGAATVAGGSCAGNTAVLGGGERDRRALRLDVHGAGLDASRRNRDRRLTFRAAGIRCRGGTPYRGRTNTSSTGAGSVRRTGTVRDRYGYHQESHQRTPRDHGAGRRGAAADGRAAAPRPPGPCSVADNHTFCSGRIPFWFGRPRSAHRGRDTAHPTSPHLGRERHAPRHAHGPIPSDRGGGRRRIGTGRSGGSVPDVGAKGRGAAGFQPGVLRPGTRQSRHRLVLRVSLLRVVHPIGAVATVGRSNSPDRRGDRSDRSRGNAAASPLRPADPPSCHRRRIAGDRLGHGRPVGGATDAADLVVGNRHHVCDVRRNPTAATRFRDPGRYRVLTRDVRGALQPTAGLPRGSRHNIPPLGARSDAARMSSARAYEHPRAAVLRRRVSHRGRATTQL